MARRPPAERDGLSVEELSDEQPFSRALLYREIRAGHIPHLRIAGRIVVSRKAFLEYARREAEHHVNGDGARIDAKAARMP